MRRLILTFVALDGFARALLGQSSDQFALVRAAMHRLVDTMGSPSVAVAVAKDGRIVWEDAIGWANREKRIPATANTIYPLASISKPITATGLMVLVERSQVDLDSPIDAYLGTAKLTGLGGEATRATVRRVRQGRCPALLVAYLGRDGDEVRRWVAPTVAHQASVREALGWAPQGEALRE